MKTWRKLLLCLICSAAVSCQVYTENSSRVLVNRKGEKYESGEEEAEKWDESNPVGWDQPVD